MIICIAVKQSFFVPQQNDDTNVVVLCLNGLNYVKFKYRMHEYIFLLDTGASISIIFSKYLSSNEHINTSKKVKINGIAGSTYSLGSANILLSIDDIEFKHEFLVVESFGSNMHGVIGSDFFSKFSAIVDYEKFLFSFWNRNNKVCTPLQSLYDCEVDIPPRCEIIKYFSVDFEYDCLVAPEEVCEGVYVAGVAARPTNNLIPVRLLNVNEREVKLRNFRPRVERLTDYEICKFADSEVSVKRVEKVLNSIKLDGLSKQEKTSVEKICAKYVDVFHLDDDPLTVANVSKQKIHLKDDAVPVYVKPYRLPHAQKAEIHKQVNKMLRDGVIEETKSEWSSPLLIVPKKVDNNGNKKWRVVIDYRLLNKQIRDDKFPLPCISEILDSLSGAMLFSHLDLAQSYYQCELHPSSRPYTSFTTDRGQYQMTRLPMGLKVSPSSFSRVMTVAMSGLNYESCFVYLDDLVIFGNNLASHNKNLIKVLQRLREVNLKLNPNKCEFLKKEMLYLGHVISGDGISPDPEKIQAVKNYPVPKSAEETKRFVAFANYYRKFIKGFAQIVYPLNKLTRKNATFDWNGECQTAFETLKHALINPPLLQYPDFSENNQFILKTDASGQAIGAVLSNGDDKPVAYASRSLNKAEVNYCTIEKELLAIVWAVKHFRPYLYARKFKVLTDHRPLVYLFGMTNPSSRLTKFRLILEEYDFTVSYIKGSNNVTADALSRIQIDSSELKDMNRKVTESIYVTTRAQLSKQIQDSKSEVADSTDRRLDHPGMVELLKRPMQSVEVRPVNKVEFCKFKNLGINENGKCTDFFKSKNIFYDVNSQIIYLKQNPRSAFTLSDSLRDLKKVCKEYRIPELCVTKSDDSVYLIPEIQKIKKELNDGGTKICIVKMSQVIDDKEMRQLILNDFHMLPTGGHAGVNRMYNNVKKYYFWSGLRQDVESFVKRCDDCQRHKHSKPYREPLSVTTTATAAFQKVYLDLVGPISPDIENNTYILTLQCELSKFVEAYPIPNKEAITVAKSFVENFVLRYGIPSQIVSDCGTEFLAKIFQETCKMLNITHLNSTAYHHETLGALENSHKHLGAYLRMQSCKQPNTWSSWVPYWCFAYNNTVHTETRYTPHELVFGKQVNMPSNVNCQVDPLYSFDDYPLELRYRLQVSCNDAKDNLIASKLKRKEMVDKKSNPCSYKVGDKVLLKNNTTSKLDPLYIGPYTVVKDKSPNVILSLDGRKKLIEVHKNRIKPYFLNIQNK